MYIDDDEDDKTVFMPLDPSKQKTQPQPSSDIEISPSLAFAKLSQFDYLAGPNKLVEYASELFALHYEITNGSFQSHVEQLRLSLNDALTKFTLRSQQNGVSDKSLRSARYIICTFIDESVLSTEWGRSSDWSRQSMLSTNFNESWGGEVFYKIRLYSLEHLSEFIDVFELCYICLCLGFKGQYATNPNGQMVMDRIKRESFQVIQEYRGHSDTAGLSPSWESDYEKKKPLRQKNSLWLVSIISIAVLICIYGALSIFLNSTITPVYNQVEKQEQSVSTQANNTLQLEPHLREFAQEHKLSQPIRIIG